MGEDRKLASSLTVTKGKAFAKWLKEDDRKIAAVEMESAGGYAAVDNLKEGTAPRVISIRGISDFGDGRKEQLEEEPVPNFRTTPLDVEFGAC